MLSKCANPACSKSFQYFRDGCVFHVERDDEPAVEGKPSHNVEHFWLCGDCCQTMKIAYTADQGVKVIRRPGFPGARAA